MGKLREPLDEIQSCGLPTALEVMGERFPAIRHTRPLYDPDRTAILA